MEGLGGERGALRGEELTCTPAHLQMGSSTQDLFKSNIL